MTLFTQYKKISYSWVRSLLALSVITAIPPCAAQSSRTEFYNAEGQPSHAVHCPVGAYESCLQQIGDICNKGGYIVLEKFRQMRWGLWSDDPETLLVAQCKTNNKSSDAK